MTKIIIYIDGGSRGNPGPAAIGMAVCDEKGRIVKKYSEFLGQATNNEAEYEAVIFGLKKVKALFGKNKIKEMVVEVRTDSELLANQVNGTYKIIEPKIGLLFLKIWNLKIDFGKVEFIAIGREENKEADALVNQALDSQLNVQKLF